jgi:hypothetical protein
MKSTKSLEKLRELPSQRDLFGSKVRTMSHDNWAWGKVEAYWDRTDGLVADPYSIGIK